MKILSISDIKVPFIYSPRIRQRFAEIDLVIACGDLPYYYQEFIISALDVPLVFVRGNHDKLVEHGVCGERQAPAGGIDLHGNCINHRGLLLAGVEGCQRYSGGPFQYTQSEMWRHVLRLVPRLLVNHIVHKRYLDIFVSHAPPLGIHDNSDLPHNGIAAFRWLISVFRPAYHFHGHTHIYRPDDVTETVYKDTLVINTFGYRETSLDKISQAYYQSRS